MPSACSRWSTASVYNGGIENVCEGLNQAIINCIYPAVPLSLFLLHTLARLSTPVMHRKFARDLPPYISGQSAAARVTAPRRERTSSSLFTTHIFYMVHTSLNSMFTRTRRALFISIRMMICIANARAHMVREQQRRRQPRR